MKLNQLTLTVLAAVTACASVAAMADDNDVVVYGYIRAGVVNYNGNANSVWGYNSTKANAATTNIAGRAELNFKGSENLGNGLRSIWQVSNRFAPTGSDFDDQGGNFKGKGLATNDTFVGLKSDSLGTLVLGTNYGNMEDGKYDQTFVVGPDQIQGWYGDTEGHNMVRYDLPSFGGVNTSIQYGTSENAGSATGTGAAQHNTTLRASYDNGVWGISAAYSMANNMQTSSKMAWASNGNDIGTLGQAHLTAMFKPTDAWQLAVEMQRDTLNGNTINSNSVYAYYTAGAALFGVQAGVQSYSGNKPSALNNGKFFDAFVHYNLSKTTVAYVEVMTSKNGALSYAVDNTRPSTSRVMTDIGLSKSF